MPTNSNIIRLQLSFNTISREIRCLILVFFPRYQFIIIVELVKNITNLKWPATALIFSDLLYGKMANRQRESCRT